LAPVRTDVLEELIASIIRVSRISELRALAVTSNLAMEEIHFSETSVLTEATWHNIEDGILHGHHHENLKS
jgi:hypothetical protein